MPVSKRNRLVSLTATKKKNFSNLKEKLVTNIHECLDKYDKCFIIRIDNMRNARLKELRDEIGKSRFFFGKNKVMAIAFGRSESIEYRKNLHCLTKYLTGQCGLLFTNQSQDYIFKFIDQYRHCDYARTGDIATQTIELYEGPMKQFPHNIEPYLRQLGMPTALNKGVVTLLKDYQVCKKGQQLTSEQARILKLLDIKMAEFRITIDAMWCNDGKFELFNRPEAIMEQNGGDKGDGMDEDDDEELE